MSATNMSEFAAKVAQMPEATLIDAYAEMKQKMKSIADLQDVFDAELKKRHPEGGKYEGNFNRINIITYPGREKWDGAWLKNHLTPGELAVALSMGKPYLQLRVTPKSVGEY